MRIIVGTCDTESIEAIFWNSPGFLQVSTKFQEVLLDFFGFHWVLPSFTAFP